MSLVEKLGFKLSLKSPFFFHNVARPLLYRKHSDPEDIHAKAIEALNEYEPVIARNAHLFRSSVTREIKGKHVKPIGSAAGLDKNADALKPLSHIFGFQKTGTIVLNQRQGNAQPRVAVDNANFTVYNAQGFPSKGLEYALQKIRAYRWSGGDAVIYASVCGLPNEKDPIKSARHELEEILLNLAPLVDGIEWNPFSPNTAALKELRTTESFYKHAELARKIMHDRLVVVKMGPMVDENKAEWLDLVDAFIDGGGDGATAVNTFMVDKSKVPSDSWGYPSAGQSGRAIATLRRCALREARERFPDAVLFAAGGIFDDPEDVKETYELATAIEGYTPYTFYGFGLVRNQLKILEEYERSRE